MFELPAKELVEESSAPKKIERIKFGLFSGIEMIKVSEVQVVNKDPYQHPLRTPMPYGPLDLRMGTSSKKDNCATCGQKVETCSGHFGYIHLALPCYHIGFMKQIQNVLALICKTCSRSLFEEKERQNWLRRMRSARDATRRNEIVKKVLKAAKAQSICPHCGARNGDIKKVGALKLIHRKWREKDSEEEKSRFLSEFNEAIHYNEELSAYVSKAHEVLNPLRVLKLFERVRPEDVELLNMDPKVARPEWLILTHLLVPPACIRPSVQMETVGGSNEDDLTIKLGDIVLINDLIRKSMEHGNPITQLADKWEFLQQSVALYINSEYPGIPASLAAKKAIRGLAQRLKGKQGRFRGNLSGKRVDFSSRTVISPDPNIRVDEVGLPLYICKILTYPERVTKYNIDELRKLILNGNDEYPGARFVEYPNGDKKFLKYARRDQIASSLKIGDIVERHLRNGDIVLFNRQPSLHRNSIMAHRVRVLPDRTFRLNECVCTPYNADFDGDEMNIHVPQTEEARAEAAVLLSVPNNLCVPKSGELIIAAIQDFLTASYLITKKDTFYDRAVFVQIVSYFTDGLLDVELPQPAILKPMELFTGKQIFSVLINPNPSKCPVNVSFEQKNRNYNAAKDYGPMDPTDCYIIVQNGELLTGQLDKAALGGGRGNLFHVLSKDFDPNIAVDRMSRLARLCSRWITNHGFSMGISDVQPSQDLVNKKIKLVNQGYAKCEEYIQQAKEGKLKPQPGLTLEQTLEGLITSELSSLRDQAGKLCMDELQTWNPPLIMTLCGSKGSKINISQMIAAVGQQTVGGSRIPNGFVNRTLPHFDVNAKDPAAKGFVSNSFYSGLTPTEFFFHTMAGREGLVDTAVKTAETGYMQRRLMKALEDLAVQYDGTVRQSSGGVVQFTYGDDSFDPAQIEHEENPCDYQRILLNCFCFSRHGMYLEPQEIVDFVDTKLASEKFSYLSDHHKQNLRLVWRNDTKAKNSKDQLIVGLVDKIVELRKSLSLPSGLKENEDTKAETAKKTDDLSPITTGLNIHDQSANSLKELYEEKINFVRRIYPVTDVMLDNFFERVNKKLRKIQMHAGEAVGAVAAQSIGEPCTQMTLKTFHFAGVASMNITLGVPRIQEIINATKTISTPIITGKLVGPESPVFQRIMSHVSKNRQIVGNERELFARIIKGRIEKTTLGDVAEYIAEIYRPGQCSIEIKVDFNTIINLFLNVSMNTIRQAILEHKKMKLKPDMVTIGGKAGNKIIITPSETRKQNLYHTIHQLKNWLPEVIISGVPTVNRVVISLEEGKKDKNAPDSYELLLEGTDLGAVLAIPGIDGLRSKSNHILEVQKALGIEAARRAIINEIRYTMSQHGVMVDPRHLFLLADCMTYRGEVLGITRHGIAKMKDSVIMLASFERTNDVLFDAAAHSMVDSVNGVSESIIMGRPVPVGTGLFKILKRCARLENFEATPTFNYIIV